MDRRTSAPARALFLAFQYPTVIPGVSMANFLRMAVTNARNARAEDIAANGGTAQKMTPREFRRLMKEKMALLKMDDSFATRYLNEGFSGGEKKRAEILQMALLEPTTGGARRDRLRARHRRAASRFRRRQRPGRTRDGHAAHHPLPAAAEPHQAALRAHRDGRSHRPAKAGRSWRMSSRRRATRTLRAEMAASGQETIECH